MLHLRLDGLPVIIFQTGHIDLVVEVADVADDGLVFHRQQMFMGDHIAVAGGGDKDVRLMANLVHSDHAVAFHRRLQGAYRIHLGDAHRGAQAAQGLRATLADIAVAKHDGGLPRHHDISGALDAIH